MHAAFAAASAAFALSSSVGGGSFAKTDAANVAAIRAATRRMAVLNISKSGIDEYVKIVARPFREFCAPSHISCYKMRGPREEWDPHLPKRRVALTGGAITLLLKRLEALRPPSLLLIFSPDRASGSAVASQAGA